MLMKIKYPADRSEAASGGTCQVVALANFWQLGASKIRFEAPSSGALRVPSQVRFPFQPRRRPWRPFALGPPCLQELQLIPENSNPFC